MSTTRPARRFSMIREFHLADWFTLGNAICGTGALFSIISYIATEDVLHVYYATGLIFSALVFDILDGRIARGRL
jgi:CDP-diacylglycerol--serine O-phosphatidyltransferase